TPLDHAPAVAIGLFPAIAAWGLNLVQGAFFAAGGTTMQAVLEKNPNAELNGYLLHGLIVIDRGYIFTCMILAAISAFLIDRKFFTAGFWSLLAAGFAVLGLTHAYQLQGNIFDFLMLAADPLPGSRVFRADTVAAGYALMAAAFFAFGVYSRRQGHLPRVGH
ncbi:MAG TPA: NCS2 family permease, partial [Planctomycetaceae bacterium]|nr:NCS2 family permease [Planctomycetaceae bacterium]